MPHEISKFVLQNGDTIELYVNDDTMSLSIGPESPYYYAEGCDVDLTEDEVFRLIDGLTDMVEDTTGIKPHIHQCNVLENHTSHVWRPLHDVSGISIVTCPGVESD